MLLVIWAIIAVAIAWCFMGQPFTGFFGYFLAQQRIISGYSEAMSLNGPAFEVIAYLGGALVIWLAVVMARLTLWKTNGHVASACWSFSS